MRCNMRVTALTENTTEIGLRTEHGLSLYIETDDKKILFDSGQTELFAENAGHLGIDLSSVDMMILSHGHYDHGGGLKKFIEINQKAPIYMSRYAFEPHYNGRNEYIGLDPTLDGHPRYVKVQGDVKIDDELSFVCMTRLKSPVHTNGQKVKLGPYMQNERYEHEMYLLIHEGYKDHLISGCAHKGIINLVHAFRFQTFIGGLHLMKLDPLWAEEILDDTVKAVKDSYAEYYTCHCTGKEQFLYLKDEIGEKMHEISCGETIEIQ